MSTKIESFEDLEAWQIAHKLALEVYRASKKFPKEELYCLVSQVRRAALSITSNIAEGFSRFHFNDKIRFYFNARGPVSEVKNCLILSKDLGYIIQSDCEALLLDSDKVMKLINGLTRSIEKQK